MKRAHSLFEIKSVDDEKRVIEGIATTPTPDRMGDIVEPKGAVFKLPLPLLWQHQASQPVGHVLAADVRDDGIHVRVQVAKVDEPGTLKNRLDEAWQSVKSGLVRGFSIGFNDLESSQLKDSWSLHFLKWEWLELSMVTIPANSECSITAIKSADQAALGQRRSAVYLKSTPGASGLKPPKKEPEMNFQQQITAFEAKRAASAARRDEIQAAAVEAQRSKTAEEKEEFDNLNAEISTIDAELVDLKSLVADQAKGAKPVRQESPEARTPTTVESKGAGYVTTNANVEKGIGLVRAAMALHRAKGDRTLAANLFRNEKRWMDQTPHGELYLKAAVAAGDTTTSGWASELAYARDLESEFVEYLRPKTVIGRISNLRRVPFNIRYGTQSAGVTGSWVGQGQPVPVAKPTFSSGSLGIAKASVIVAIDEELAKLSSPSAEMLVREDMAKGVQEFLDRQFLNPDVAASANVSPASITNGVTATAASGTNAAAVRTDIATMLTALSRTEMDVSQLVLIMAPETAMQIGLMVTSLGVLQFPDIGLNGGSLLGIPVVTSNCANISGSPASGRMIIAAVANEIQLADEGGVAIDVSRETALQLLDNPTNASTSGTTATSMVSMFQTHSMALRCTRFINWAKRRTGCVEFIRDAAYVA
jgi:HK97 family phage major capsid protein/HK97 family phage prohead protease